MRRETRQPKMPSGLALPRERHIGGPSQPEQHFTSRRIDAGRRATIADAGTPNPEPGLMAELSESITQLPAGDDLAALLLKRWTSGADADTPENTSDDGSWVDVAPDDERNDWCVLRTDEIDGA